MKLIYPILSLISTPFIAATPVVIASELKNQSNWSGPTEPISVVFNSKFNVSQNFDFEQYKHGFHGGAGIGYRSEGRATAHENNYALPNQNLQFKATISLPTFNLLKTQELNLTKLDKFEYAESTEVLSEKMIGFVGKIATGHKYHNDHYTEASSKWFVKDPHSYINNNKNKYTDNMADGGINLVNSYLNSSGMEFGFHYTARNQDTVWRTCSSGDAICCCSSSAYADVCEIVRMNTSAFNIKMEMDGENHKFNFTIYENGKGDPWDYYLFMYMNPSDMVHRTCPTFNTACHWSPSTGNQMWQNKTTEYGDKVEFVPRDWGVSKVNKFEASTSIFDIKAEYAPVNPLEE